MVTGRRLIEQCFVCVPAFCRVNQASNLQIIPEGSLAMQFARLNGVVIHHQVIGAAPDKPTIVFANSLGTDYRIWRDVIVRMVGDYSIIAYDKRGHGLSELGDAEITMDDHINDLIALIEHFEAKNVILCGLSVGGMIAQGVAAKRPDLVRAMILCDTGHKIGTADMWNARISAIKEQGIDDVRGRDPGALVCQGLPQGRQCRLYRLPDDARTHTGRRLCRHLCRDSGQRFHQVEFGTSDAGHLRGGHRGRFDTAVSGGGNGAVDPGRDVPGDPRSRTPALHRKTG